MERWIQNGYFVPDFNAFRCISVRLQGESTGSISVDATKRPKYVWFFNLYP